MRKSILFLALGLMMTLGAQAAKEVYTVFNNGTLTYYYDDQKDSRSGIKEVYDPVNNPDRFEGYGNEVKTAVIDASMLDARLESMEALFWSKAGALKKLTSIVGMENLYTASVTNMVSMFAWCESLTSIDLHAFNTSKVTNMINMFKSCLALKEIDVNSFDMSKVEDADMMFDYCESLTTIYCDADWSKFPSIKGSNSMFRGCEKLVGGSGTVYDENNVNITYALPDGKDGKPGYFTGTMPVYSVYSANTLTFYCDYKMNSRSGMKDVYDPATVTTVKRFEGYNELVTTAVIDPSMAKAQLTSLRNMFYSEVGSYFANLPNLATITGLENLNTEKVTDMSSMFGGCWALTAPLNLSNFNTANVTDMNSMFAGCNVLAELDLTSFDVTKVTNMTSMFQGCKNLTTIYCEKDWTTGVVTKSSNMFENCKKLQGDKGTKWVTGNPQDITYARPDEGTAKPGYFSKKTITAINEMSTINYQLSTKKIIRNGHLYIQRGEELFNAQGARVK